MGWKMFLHSVRMVLEPEPGAFVLSDLSSGPVLFATC